MKKLTLTSIALSLALASANAQTLTSSDAGFVTFDDFSGDTVGTISSPFTTAAGGAITFTNTGGSVAIAAENASGESNGAPVLFGPNILRRNIGTGGSHSLTYNFGTTVTGFGVNLADIGDGNIDFAKITASDGTVIYLHDEPGGTLDDLGNDNQFRGVTGGSFTGFTWESNTDANDNHFIDRVAVIPVPEPSSALLLGLSGLALIGRRKRA